MKKQIKIAYFPSTASKTVVLGSNGKSLDNYCIKCETEEDLSNGNYILDATFVVADNMVVLFEEEVILKVAMDYGYEVFRISKVMVGTRYIDIVARQITIADSLTLWLEDVRPTNMSGSASANYLLSNSTGLKEIQIVSDIPKLSTAYYMRMSLYKALSCSDNAFINRWGGEVQRRGYIAYINSHVGTSRGVSIREGKNLTGFNGDTNIDTLTTRARGQGFDGILGNYIDSPLIGKYNRVYTDVIKYEDVKVKDENNDEGYETLEQAQAELDRRVKEEFSINGIDKIKANYNINFVQLEKTEEYKNYISAERVYIGDTVRVYVPKIKIDINVRAIYKTYDVLAQKTIEIKLSNYIESTPLTIKQLADKLDNIDSTDTILQQAKDNATLMIKSGLKNSYVVVRENEIVIGDTKDINTMVNVWRFNKNGLGHSGTGYYGEFGTAITADGQIVATFITTGILNANLIKAGILKSFNNKTWINMEYGTFNFADRIRFDGNKLDITLNSGDNLESSLKTRVTKNGLGTEIEQNQYAVKIAWNKISNYVQFENGGLSIYNGAVETSKKRAVFDENGNHFWRDGYYLGKIGTNKYKNDESLKGIVFDLEAQGAYMSWSVLQYSGASEYTIVWAYANKAIGNYGANMLHAGADIDMHNYTLRNVKFEGGAITGTLNFVQITNMNSDGTAQNWKNNSKLQFQNGILIGATW